MTEENEGNNNTPNTFRTSVIASVIASVIIIILIQPILTWFWSLLSSTGNDFINSLVDRIYKNAALGDRNWVIAIFAIFLLYVPYVYSVTRIASMIIARKLMDDDNESKRKRTFVRLLVAFGISFIVGISAATVPASYIYTDLQLNASFNQRLSVLAPRLTLLQEEELKAAWALMKSKKDYLIIKEKMEKFATESNIQLPAPLLSD